MTGFEAISAQNGWVMAATGAMIVMSGLTILATIISQLHKVIALFERKRVEEHAPPTTPRVNLPADPFTDLPAAAAIYQALSVELGNSFLLVDLFEVLKQGGNPHPHMTIRTFREGGYLLPLGESRFKWKS